MHHRRSQGEAKSTSSITSTLSTMPTNTNSSSSMTSNPGRVSIYCMRDRVILNKMTKIMSKLAPDTETEVTSRLHQEIPAIRLDGHLTYCLYIAFQNLLHLNTIYIFLYHAVFWLGSTQYHAENIQSTQSLDKSSYEETQLVFISNQQYSNIGTSINTKLIDKYVYFAFVALSLFELVNAFLWTVRKKLPYLIQRHQKLKSRLSFLLVGVIAISYLSFFSWILYHTLMTRHFSQFFGFSLLSHFVILTLLDKTNLFQPSPYRFSKQSLVSRQVHRTSTSSSSTSSMAPANLGRHSYRSSTSMQSRKLNPLLQAAASSSSSSLFAWSRWSSITEERIPTHECSSFYAQARQEADELWPNFWRRIVLNFYRTFSSCFFYDFLPIQMMGSRERSIDRWSLFLLILIFSLGALITHSAFLFPVKLQITLHRIATHLGQWRCQALIRTETIPEWSSECNSYTRGSVVKLSSNHQQHFLAIQHLHNAADPQSRVHSFLYRLFGDATHFLTTQFILCGALVVLNIIWIIRGKHWQEMLIGCSIVFSNCYPIYKIVRDRLIMDSVEEHESSQIASTDKQTKLS